MSNLNVSEEQMNAFLKFQEQQKAGYKPKGKYGLAVGNFTKNIGAAFSNLAKESEVSNKVNNARMGLASIIMPK